MRELAFRVIILASVAVAAVVGYRSLLHGIVGATVLAVMTLTCWVSHARGTLLRKYPAREFLRMARNNALSAADAAANAYREQHDLVTLLSGEMTHEQRERECFRAQAHAAYRQALTDAKAARDSSCEWVQQVGGRLEEHIKELTPEEFMNRGWSLYKVA